MSNNRATGSSASFSAASIGRALGGQPSGGEWLALCPVPTHGKGKGDRKPSLSLRDGGPRGEVLVHCFAGCSGKDIISALKGPRVVVRQSVKSGRARGNSIRGPRAGVRGCCSKDGARLEAQARRRSTRKSMT